MYNMYNHKELTKAVTKMHTIIIKSTSFYVIMQ